jgi:restriction endonuclease Mrr
MEQFVVKLGVARERAMADKGVFVTAATFSKKARATAARHD